MKRLLIFALITVSTFGVLAITKLYYVPEAIISLDINRLKEKGAIAFEFCKNHKLDTTYCILIDMSIHSGKNRIVVWDFKSDQIMDQGLVSHGCCDLPWGGDLSRTNPEFKNIPDSHCSSLGKYSIGKRGYSQWGINVNYKLHGLESTNNLAYERIIVLHSWVAIPEEECFPNGTPEGWGCPAVSNEFMKRLDEKLKHKSKDVLLWIFYD
jgi:hypothetical protein